MPVEYAMSFFFSGVLVFRVYWRFLDCCDTATDRTNSQEGKKKEAPLCLSLFLRRHRCTSLKKTSF
jgi:hypothetical protein